MAWVRLCSGRKASRVLKNPASLEKAEIKVEAERGSDHPHLSLSPDLSLPRALPFDRGANVN